MKTIILSLLPFLIYAQTLLLFDDPYNKETRDYIARVNADGGVVISPDTIFAITEIARTNGTLDSLHFWYNVYGGVKKDANNKVTKIYSIIGTKDAVQADTSKAWTYAAGKFTSDTDDYYNTTITISATNFEQSGLVGLTFNIGTLANQRIITNIDGVAPGEKCTFYAVNNGGANKLRLANQPASGTVTTLSVSSAKHYLGFRITENVTDECYLDGTGSGTSVAANTLIADITYVRIGASIGPDSYLKNAEIYEMKLFTKNLSAAKWTLEQTYFNERY